MQQTGSVILLVLTLFIAISLSISVFSPWYEIKRDEDVNVHKVYLFNWAGIIEHMKNETHVATTFQSWESNKLFHVRELFHVALGFLIVSAVLV
jgi:hypothetical protein